MTGDRRAASPVAGDVAVLDWGGQHGVTSFVVGQDEPVLAGHYPGFPIFPGVCLVECAHRSAGAFAARAGRRLRLTCVESTRFLAPVFPGDEVLTRMRVQEVEGGWRCRAELSVGERPVATVRLRMEAP